MLFSSIQPHALALTPMHCMISTKWLCTSRITHLKHTKHMEVNVMVYVERFAQVRNIIRSPCWILDPPELRYQVTVAKQYNQPQLFEHKDGVAEMNA